MTKLDETAERVKEIRKIYDISEAEMALISQMAMVVKITMDVSPELLVKLVKAYAAMVEAVHENMTKSNGKNKDS